MKLWVAQGFGVGRIRYAPGTWGSVVGLGWMALLESAHSWPVFIVGNALAIALSIWLCGEGERILGKKDPGSIVLDEIVAIPLCFTGWLAMLWRPHHLWPSLQYFWANFASTAGVFLLFRFFDVLKPWPIRQSQSLPGGWGVTVDDLLAAVYVNAVVFIARAVWTLLH